MLTKELLLAGNATFTVEPPDSWVKMKAGRKAHYTFRVRKSRDGAEAWFLDFMTGCDNTRSYEYVGLVDKATGRIIKTKASKDISGTAYAIAESVLTRIFAGEGRKVEDAGWNVHHAGRCCRCGRKLTVPASVQTGIGPECEDFMTLGIAAIDEIPYLPSPLTRTPDDFRVANLQYCWWKSGLESTLAVLHDACLDAGMDDAKAIALVNLTKRATRHFKGGKRLSRDFVMYALPDRRKRELGLIA